MKFKLWFYRLYKLRLRYVLDKEAMVGFVDINKPEGLLIGDERSTLDTLVAHFTTLGYCVIVRD